MAAPAAAGTCQEKRPSGVSGTATCWPMCSRTTAPLSAAVRTAGPVRVGAGLSGTGLDGCARAVPATCGLAVAVRAGAAVAVTAAGRPAGCPAAWVPQAASTVVSAATAARQKAFTRHSTYRAGCRLHLLLSRHGILAPGSGAIAGRGARGRASTVTAALRDSGRRSAPAPSRPRLRVTPARGAQAPHGKAIGTGAVRGRGGLFPISVAAELAGLHPQTLRFYEREGLLDPARSAGGTRRYSRRDIDRLAEICALTG